jgi:choline-sulfatase
MSWCRHSLIALVLALSACNSPSPPPGPPPASARNLVLVTIDTLRADRVGAYGYTRARTPAIDALARRGARFDKAYATAPITLTSHASLMTGLYPPGHGGRHNGMRVDQNVPQLAETLAAAGFSTAAFVSAFPLDRRFGLNKGFATYSDRMPRGPRGRLENERPGRQTTDEAIAWLGTLSTLSTLGTKGTSGTHGTPGTPGTPGTQSVPPGPRFFLWLHLFEPHAPYGDPRSGRSTADRYDDEIAEADLQVGRVFEALGANAANSLIVVVADHGEAFGEHGEISHSLFVYDTTLRVPLVITGPGVPARVIAAPVSLADVAPTVLRLLGVKPFDADGIDLAPALAGAELPGRDLYAESFAPLLDFGWSPLRSLRSQGFKYIAAPRAELYEVERDPGETRDIVSSQPQRAADLQERVQRYSTTSLEPTERIEPEALARLQALGYVSGSGDGRAAGRADPKDRAALAARISQVTSGELQGKELETALRQILAEDPKNPQANLRLAYVLLESGRCAAAMPLLNNAIGARVPTADAHLGLALCQAEARQVDRAVATLKEAERVEPDNPVVFANLGILLSDAGRHADGIPPLQRAIELDPDFHEARFNLARVLARANRRQEAAREAEELLRRLPASAPQRAEVQRLLAALR